MSQPNLLFLLVVPSASKHHDVDLVHTANEAYWRNFGRFRVVCNRTTHFGRDMCLVLK